MNQPAKIAICVRVSTTDQSTDIQASELTLYAAQRNWTITKIYEDKKTGKDDHRSSFQELMKDAIARD